MNRALSIRMSAQEKKERARWQAEDDLRTLTTAEEIRKDKSRLQAAKALAKEKLEALQKAQAAL